MEILNRVFSAGQYILDPKKAVTDTGEGIVNAFGAVKNKAMLTLVNTIAIQFIASSKFNAKISGYPLLAAGFIVMLVEVKGFNESCKLAHRIGVAIGIVTPKVEEHEGDENPSMPIDYAGFTYTVLPQEQDESNQEKYEEISHLMNHSPVLEDREEESSAPDLLQLILPIAENSVSNVVEKIQHVHDSAIKVVNQSAETVINFTDKFLTQEQDESNQKKYKEISHLMNYSPAIANELEVQENNNEPTLFNLILGW